MGIPGGVHRSRVLGAFRTNGFNLNPAVKTDHGLHKYPRIKAEIVMEFWLTQR
jgi:hypothetical protein